MKGQRKLFKFKTQICKECKMEKSFSEFHKNINTLSGYSYRCKNCASLIAWKYRDSNKEKINLRNRERDKQRKETDPLYKLRRKYSNMINDFVKNNGFTEYENAEKIIGCNYKNLKKYIEKQFKEDMDWENRGEWHIDHRIPLASANNQEELIKLNHFTNLQPMWAENNLSKGNKFRKKDKEKFLEFYDKYFVKSKAPKKINKTKFDFDYYYNLNFIKNNILKAIVYILLFPFYIAFLVLVPPIIIMIPVWILSKIIELFENV
tara:strand:- start:112 stop:900 length:789 start_codon:yes stop_codon:yes gene_type:complete